MPNKVTEFLEKISNQLTERLALNYIIALVAGCVPFLIVMIYYNWDISAFWSVGFLSGLTTFSGVIMKFLGGLGLILTYAWGCAFALRMFSKRIKGNKTAAQRMKLFLILGSLALAGYGVYNILSSLLSLPEITILTYLLTVYGIISLMLMVYILPAIKDQFQPAATESLWQKIKGKFGGFKYSLWKGYKTRARKDFGKVYAAEYDRYKTDLADIRDQLSGILLLPITLIYIGFLPLLGVSIVLWLRIFSQTKKPFHMFEKILLIVIIGVIMVLSIILFFVITDPTMLVFWNIAYGIGLIFSVCLFIYVIRNA